MNQDHNFFEAFDKMNVLIVGDVMIDRYIRGKVSRISPEAPVPVVQLESTDNRLGGAANVALNIRALGATPYLCSVIGKDENAEIFLKLLPENDLSGRGIIRSSDRVSTVKTRIMAQHQHLLRVDREDTHDLTQKEEKALLRTIRSILRQQDIHVILFQDYNKGVLTPRVIREVILEAVKRDIPTAVDPKFRNFWAYRHVTLFKPNLREIQDQMPNGVVAEAGSLQEASTYIRSRLDNQYTLITLSDKGLFIERKGENRLVGTTPRNIADVCGAGDTVISIAALSLALSLDLEEMALLANLAGGQVCEKVGVVPVDKGQLQIEYAQLLARRPRV